MVPYERKLAFLDGVPVRLACVSGDDAQAPLFHFAGVGATLNVPYRPLGVWTHNIDDSGLCPVVY